MSGIFLLGGARTPFCEWSGGKTGEGKPGGALASMSPTELGVHVATAAMERSCIPPGLIDHVVFGQTLQIGSQSAYAARHLALKAGIPMDRPALIVNRLCASGIEAVAQAGYLISQDRARTVLAGGMENLSQAPYLMPGLRSGLRLGHARMEDSLAGVLNDSHAGLMMAETAEILAMDHRISREEQDEYALRSVQRALKAREDGIFAEEIQPVPVKGRKGLSHLVEQDDHPFADCSPEKLSGLRPAFSKEGTVTAGNACGISDGAAALVVIAEAQMPPTVSPLARVVDHVSVGVEPSRMGLGAVPAIRQLLARTGRKMEEIDLLEIHEAFAAQLLAVHRNLEFDFEKTNIHGGALALGHPFGASGARMLLSLAMQLRRSGGKYGIAATCAGGGLGMAMLLEAR